MTLESWTDAQMFYFIDAVGNYAIAFFVVVVLVGGFFGLNLLLAVITAKFAQAQSSMVRPCASSGQGIFAMLTFGYKLSSLLISACQDSLGLVYTLCSQASMITTKSIWLIIL